MTHVLIAEDREILKSLFSELIENSWPKERPVKIDTCSFAEIDAIVPQKQHSTYIFNIDTDSGHNYSRIKQLIEGGHFNDKRVIISSAMSIPEIDTAGTVEIHYCNEDKFATECIPLVLN